MCGGLIWTLYRTQSVDICGLCTEHRGLTCAGLCVLLTGHSAVTCANALKDQLQFFDKGHRFLARVKFRLRDDLHQSDTYKTVLYIYIYIYIYNVPF